VELFGIAQSLAKRFGEEVPPSPSTLVAAMQSVTTCPGIVQLLLRWRGQGYPVFRLSRGLADLLLLTDCDGLRLESIPPPFDVYMVEFDHPMLMVCGTGAPSLVRAVMAGVIVIGNNGTPESAEFQVTCHLADGTEATEWWPLTSETVGDLAPSPWARGAHTLDDSKRMRRIMSTLMGLHAYLNSTSVERTEKKARKSWIRKTGERRPTVWLLGSSIVPMTAPGTSAIGGDEGAKRWKLEHQHVVRGHWRNQPCGVGLTTRKLIWIRPHWRGPEAGDAIAKLVDRERAEKRP
jgi:hypothetical protein